MDGRMLDSGQVEMEGVGRSPPPRDVCGSQAKEMLQPRREGIALPESLWHLLQVLVSVGFKLHIFKRGRVIRISMNTKHNAVWRLDLTKSAKCRSSAGKCRISQVECGHKKQHTQSITVLMHWGAGPRFQIYLEKEWVLVGRWGSNAPHWYLTFL